MIYRVEDPRFNSNDWLNPIGEKAEEILKPLGRENAIAVTSALFVNEDTGPADLPWFVSFSKDDTGSVCRGLHEAMITPDGQTPYFQVDLQEPIRQVKELLADEGALNNQFTAVHAMYYLVTVAAGQPGRAFFLYKDMARRWPQYASNWRNKLTEQFGKDDLSLALIANSDFSNLLEGGERAAMLFYEMSGSLDEEGEGTREYIERVVASLQLINGVDMGSEEGFREAVHLLDKRLDPYRIATYTLRGIPLLATE